MVAQQAECASLALTLSCGTRMRRRQRTQPRRPSGQETLVARIVSTKRLKSFYSAKKIQRGNAHADAAVDSLYSMAVVSSSDAVHTTSIARANWNIYHCRPPCTAGLRTAGLSRRQLYLDARLLGL